MDNLNFAFNSSFFFFFPVVVVLCKSFVGRGENVERGGLSQA